MLLDTCAAIAIQREPEKTDQVLREHERLFLPVVALAELYAGAFISGRLVAELEKVELIARRSQLLAIDSQTALHFAHLQTELRSKGTPIPVNDLWIAPLAIQHDLTLLTNDAHFQSIPNLRLLSW